MKTIINSLVYLPPSLLIGNTSLTISTYELLQNAEVLPFSGTPFVTGKCSAEHLPERFRTINIDRWQLPQSSMYLTCKSLIFLPDRDIRPVALRQGFNLVIAFDEPYRGYSGVCCLSHHVVCRNPTTQLVSGAISFGLDASGNVLNPMLTW